jgi:hypothetical protein
MEPRCAFITQDLPMDPNCAFPFDKPDSMGNVFNRYDIISDTDLKMAAARQEAYLKAQMVTKWLQSGTLKKKGLTPHAANPSK